MNPLFPGPFTDWSTDAELAAVSLGKWPAMVVVGEPVSIEQAERILVCTDRHLPDFKHAGNYTRMCCQYADLFGMGAIYDAPDKWNSSSLGRWTRFIQAEFQLRHRLGLLDLHMLCNSRIISSSIHGLHGWCDWDGRIGCNNYNIGKWPLAEDILNEWRTIAKAFHFLTLRCWLYDRECSEPNANPVVMYQVLDGGARGVVWKEGVVPGPSDGPAVGDFISLLLVRDQKEEFGISLTHFQDVFGRMYPRGVPQAELLRWWTTEEVRRAILSSGGTRVDAYDCPDCGEPIGIELMEGVPYFNRTCECRNEVPEASSWDAITAQLNISVDAVRDQMERAFGLTPATTLVQVLVPPVEAGSTL